MDFKIQQPVPHVQREDIWSVDDEKAITEPYTYVTSMPGKDIRGRFIDAANYWLRVAPEPLSIICKIVAMLHNASLVVDDIEDNSQLRRGQPVAHKIYGIPQAINSANYVYFLALKEASALKPFQLEGHDLNAIILHELLNLHRGQGLELVWRDSLRCPSEDQYIDMVNKKTGGLFRLAVKLMTACAPTPIDIDYVPLFNLFGVFFQIRDDLMNLDNNEYEKNKGFAEDLTEGKFSFPVIHGVCAQRDSNVLTNVLQKRPTTPTLKLHAINHLRYSTRSFEYTKSILNTLESEIRYEIEVLGGNDSLIALVDLLSVRK
ncbi:farnesyltranstransferase [Rickenella mellea]|uniref:(2E,6E)-farnesyl diphosphate synthase n=1 Tax=Rickenella mellea TaxID=50990 RepID=A0A4Y7PIH3_9AGAM|nr:farnesyltranstransferase [Rickenella mellea]